MTKSWRNATIAVLGTATLAAGLAAGPAARSGAAPPAIVLRTVPLVDETRTIHLRGGGTVPRTLVTYVRYPAHAAGPLPLVVFGHGYAVTPAPYRPLLEAWTRAGYVVAAPVFPLGNANAPGGPNEADIVNQPADVRFLISRLLAESADPASPLRGTIDPARIAVAGQSDGAETALAVAFGSPRYRDTRISAAVILSGSALPGGGAVFPLGSPPLLATLGTADAVNPPGRTRAFYDIAPRPKFLLTLLGAAHLPPYTSQQPQLGVVERVTIAFLDHYLKHGSLRALIAAGTAPGVARLTSAP